MAPPDVAQSAAGRVQFASSTQSDASTPPMNRHLNPKPYAAQAIARAGSRSPWSCGVMHVLT
jgi:hypothetical protein